ncbi:aminoacetone oxidase family FAD-binding enzyme [Ihubacter sp. rT4E-8]|uniref:aminoacetone oxidase family FAD-binding enzyme n=1 Tax=Ihubacter sp. rT4E-8 TaxID=3242369 RepID=UPI003CF8C020
MTDICIIGGGAAGMTAAICAKRENPAREVLILEKKNQLGKKILATGNGKCNLSNTSCEGSLKVLDFFESIGVLTRTDSAGRIYPYTEEARAVQSALVSQIQLLGIRVDTCAEVICVEKQRDGFRISLANRELYAKKVLIACGGKAGPANGSTGDGFRFARAMGHKVEKLIPVLTAVEVKEDTERMDGIRAKAAVSLFFQKRKVFTEVGEVQFTRNGISGICVFNLSRYLLIPKGSSLANGFDDYRIEVDFFPEFEIDDLEKLLIKRQGDGFDGERLLQFLVRGPIANRIIELSKGDMKTTVKLLKAFPLTPSGVRGWDFAQVTKGGVCMDEVDDQTCQSRLTDGLFFAGEVLDYDGPCGGYNLQHAWETGMRAGREMAK